MASQTETEKVRFRYWNEFKNYLADSGSDLSVGTPRAKQNNWIKIGPSNMFQEGRLPPRSFRSGQTGDQGEFRARGSR